MAGEIVGAVTSTGQLGETEVRSHDRVGRNHIETITTYQELENQWHLLLGEASELTTNPRERRRVFLRTWVNNDTFEDLLEQQTNNWKRIPRLETAIPESAIDPNISEDEQRYLITLAHNDHNLTMGVREVWRYEAFIDSQQTMRINRAEHVARLADNYEFITELTNENDVLDVVSLWEETFGWTKQGIEQAFINRLANTSFIGVRNKETGEIIAACMAEWFEYNGCWYVELTEWRAKIGGIASGMTEVLIANVLQKLYYNEPEDERLLVLFLAEQNLFHKNDIELNDRKIDHEHETLGSPGAGLSAGLRAPSQFNLLEHNVIVDQGRALPNDEDTEPNTELNNFVLGVLFWQTIQDTYSQEQTTKILENAGVIYENHLQPTT